MANALIYIKGKRDPVIVSVERGRVIKRLRFGESNDFGEVTGKSDPRDEIDLGDVWSGEIGQIRAVEIEKEFKKPDIDAEQEEKDRKANERWIKQTPEKKAAHYEYFKICWSSRHGFQRVEVPQDVLQKVYKIQLEYFRANPTASVVPSDNFNSVLPPKQGQKTLAEKMRSNMGIDDIPA